MRGTLRGCSLTRFTIEELYGALRKAGLDQTTMLQVIGELINVKHKTRKGGRPPEDDAERLEAMAVLVQVGFSRWRAAGMVTEELPEPPRATVRKRIYGKFKAPPLPETQE